MADLIVVLEGVRNPQKFPRLFEVPGVEVRPAKGASELARAMPGAEVVLGFGFRDHALSAAWGAAGELRWIQWCAAGVDTLLFPALVESDVVVTNAAGLFDAAIAEWVVGMVVVFARDFPRSWSAQSARRWEFFDGRRVAGTSAVIIGAGGIGRTIARSLGHLGVEVTLAASTARADDEFGSVVRWHPEVAGGADWVIAALPGTPSTMDLIDRNTFDAMRPDGVFINVGRGDTVVEPDLREALRSGSIGGAALDVVRNEPLQPDSEWWDVPNLVLTPHNSGDVGETLDDIVDLFLDNLGRYRRGEPLRNVVDKRRGY